MVSMVKINIKGIGDTVAITTQGCEKMSGDWSKAPQMELFVY